MSGRYLLRKRKSAEVTSESKKQKGETLESCLDDFTIDLYKEVASQQTNRNLITSPISVQMVLAMAAYGANGTTAKQMRKALHLPENDDQTLREYQSMITFFEDLPQAELSIANKLCISSDPSLIQINDKFKEITSEYFHSEPAIIDFTKVAESVKKINDWCLKKTNRKISKVLNKDSVCRETALFLLNAVYFKARWENVFEMDQTRPEDFHVNETNTIKVSTMHRDGYYNYKEIPEIDAQCICLPYKNNNLSMQIVVPKNVDGLKKIEQNIQKITYDGFEDTPLILSMPKFKVRTDIDLNLHLKKMGIKNMFEELKADFNNISDIKPLYVKSAKQKILIEVNENGTEAAAVTYASMCGGGRCTEIKVDRPFFYRIVYNNITLFAGHIVNPLKR